VEGAGGLDTGEDAHGGVARGRAGKRSEAGSERVALGSVRSTNLTREPVRRQRFEVAC
jgi:hypothetical protein